MPTAPAATAVARETLTGVVHGGIWKVITTTVPTSTINTAKFSVLYDKGQHKAKLT